MIDINFVLLLVLVFMHKIFSIKLGLFQLLQSSWSFILHICRRCTAKFVSVYVIENLIAPSSREKFKVLCSSKGKRMEFNLIFNYEIKDSNKGGWKLHKSALSLLIIQSVKWKIQWNFFAKHFSNSHWIFHTEAKNFSQHVPFRFPLFGIKALILCISGASWIFFSLLSVI